MLFRRPKVMIVLGGGGVRGLAHLGVLQVLEEAEIPIDGIVGTSAGSIIGAMYARDPNAKAVTAKVIEFLESSAFRRLNLRFEFESRSAREAKPSFVERLLNGLRKQLAMELLFRRPAIFTAEILDRLVGGLVGDGRIEDSLIPLCITAMDLIEGEEQLLQTGDIRSAIVASSAVPGFFPPVKRNGRLLTDAGLINNMPVDGARRLGAECVIAVSLNNQIDEISEFPTGIDVIFRNEEIGTKLINDRKKKEADVVIEPDLEGRYWLDFRESDRVVRAGEAATRAVLTAIRAAVGRKRLAIL